MLDFALVALIVVVVGVVLLGAGRGMPGRGF
jgi:hypothetical protein